MTDHTLDDSTVHAYWDNSEPPRLTIEPGDIVTFECRDASDGQMTPGCPADTLLGLDRSRIHALTGPVSIEGAKPGDTLVIDILDFKNKAWGWTGHVPGLGLLHEEFDFPFVQHWELSDTMCTMTDEPRVQVPFEPFCGVMGVGPREPGRLNTIPPRENGGNVDIRGLCAGATLYLPVLVDGALFSCGDCHSAQGDGEVSGTGIESPMTVTLKFDVKKGRTLRELQFTTPSPLTKCDSKGYYCTTAHGSDLYELSQRALRTMIDWIEENWGLSRSQALALCSAAADLKISEIVDAPNWIVSCYMPLAVFKG